MLSLKYKEARVDFCWRKKGWLGWYNGKLYGYPTIVTMDKKKFELDRKYEYSPMKFPIFYEFKHLIHNILKDSPLDIYVRFESKQTYADFTAVYPANVRSILELNNGDGFWEKFTKLFKKALSSYGSQYGSKFLTYYWNENMN